MKIACLVRTIVIKFSLLCGLMLTSLANHATEFPPITVVTEQLAPFQMMQPDGTLGGFSTEVVQTLLNEVNLPTDIMVMSWARAYNIARTEQNVLIFSIAHTTHRDNLFHWIGKLTPERLYFWGMKEKFPNMVNDINELKPYKVAVSRQSNAEYFLLESDFDNIFQLVKEEQNMQLLYRNRVDLIIATELTIKSRAQRLGLDVNAITKIAAIERLNYDLSIAMSLDSDAELVKRLQDTYQQLEQQGKIDTLRTKWAIH